MRILYVCGDHGIPVFGRKGSSTHVREMVAAWVRAGHEVLLAAADLGGDRRPEETVRTLALPRPKSRLIGHDGRYILANWQAAKVLRRAVSEFRPDGIYERSALYFEAAQDVACEAGIPRILEVNTLLAEEQADRLHFGDWARRREAALMRNAPAIASISSHMKRQLLALGCEGARIRPFSMAVNPERFAPERQGPDRRAEVGWSDDVLVLGYAGSMNTYQRPEWFMDLAEKMLRRGEKSFRFLIVGGSATKIERHRERLRQWVDEGMVRFVGTVSQEDMAGWFRAMDAVLVPGTAPQATPTKLFEGAATGRIMILPATEPIAEICGQDSALLFKHEDFHDFERVVRRFCEDRTPFRRDADRLRATVLAGHTWAHHSARLVDWFAELGAVKR